MRRAFGSLAIVLLVTAAQPSETLGQSKLPETATTVLLRVEGDVPRSLKLTAADLAKLRRRAVKAKDHAGNEAEFDGVLVFDILREAGVKFGTELRGPALTLYLVVEASDGYRAVFSLPELDPDFVDGVILLADRRDGKPLDANEGPLRVVVPAEKRHSRWVRQVVTFRIGRAQP